jgi:prepilin-type N-terminal cleavage/methylation domain-containing protein
MRGHCKGIRVTGKTRPGFTLVEFLIVAVIVAILAAAAVPLFSGNRESAMISEAKAGLGTARSCLRAMYAETRAYNRTPRGDVLEDGDPLTSIPGVGEGSLQGRYFQETDYTIQTISPNSYVLKCEGSQDPVAGIVVTLDEAGNFMVGRLGNSGRSSSGGSGGGSASGSGGEDSGDEDPPREIPNPGPIKPPRGRGHSPVVPPTMPPVPIDPPSPQI